MHAVRMCVCKYVYSMQVYIRVCMHHVCNVYVHVGVPVCMHACTYVYALCSYAIAICMYVRIS